MTKDHLSTITLSSNPSEIAWLQHELEQMQATRHRLLRQIEQEQASHQNIMQTYKNIVEHLVEISRQTMELERERDLWRARLSASGIATVLDEQITLTMDEIGAIRRAMARLHHPDAGGDTERMQIWNVVLDRLEQ